MKGNKYIFESDRLGFRLWKEDDIESFIKLNSDIDVMRFFPSILSEKESREFFKKIEKEFDKNGYGLWAVEIKETEELIGMIGFTEINFEIDHTPAIEISWRLSKKYWKQGYAIEGARACLDYGYKELELDEVYSFTSIINKPSETVMKRLGMEKIDEFRHPNIDKKSNISRHVLYKIDKEEYLKES